MARGAEREMIGMDDSKSNRHIVEMIKKIALAIESKNTKELREIAEELEAWQPRENWDDMDVRTKVFVEHVLVGLARIQLGMDVLDQGAHELGEVREKLERALDDLDREEKYAGAPYEQDEDEDDIRRTFDRQDVENRIGRCAKCRRVADRKSKSFKDYGICKSCLDSTPDIDEIYNDKTIQPKSKASVGEELFPKEMSWDEKERRRTELAKWFDKMKRNFSDGKGWIDWKKYHESREKDARDKRRKVNRGNRKGRYRKDEISDETKEDLK